MRELRLDLGVLVSTGSVLARTGEKPGSGGWGPFLPDLDDGERKARLRTLRLAVKLLAGPRGREVGVALLATEISGGDPDALAEAETAFDALPSLDRRRVLSAFAGTL